MFSKMSTEMFEDHCWAKVKAFKAPEILKAADEEAMKEVKKMRAAPKMPDFTAEDKDFEKTHPERVGEWSHYAGVVVVMTAVVGSSCVLWLVLVVSP